MRIVPKPNHLTLYESKCFFDENMYHEKLVSGLGEDEYILEATFGGGVTLSAGSEKALFYGRCTFEQIRCEYGTVLPAFRIEDKPVFGYRAFMIDCSRHFFSVEELKRIIDSMALLKFNVFHWHLADDQGWRIECEKYPELHEKASVRESSDFGGVHINKPYGGYYTVAELREVVEFCKDRYIDVVPELDVPGHCSALLSVMPELSCLGGRTRVQTHQGIFDGVLCPAKDRVYEVLEDIFQMLFEIFPFGYYHIGGDEAPRKNWSECPDCRKLMEQLGIDSFDEYQLYFMNRIIELIGKAGKTAIVWNDCLKSNGLDKSAVVQHWMITGKGKSATVKWANAGRKVILSPLDRYYMDYPYGMTSLKKVYNYKIGIKGFDLRGRESILGVECPAWTEYIDDNTSLEQMFFPRALAVADAGWCGNEDKNFRKFLKDIKIPLRLIKRKGVHYMPRREWVPGIISSVVQAVKFSVRGLKK